MRHDRRRRDWETAFVYAGTFAILAAVAALGVALVAGGGWLVTTGFALLVASWMCVYVVGVFGHSIADEPPEEHIIRRFRRTLERDLRRLGRSH